MLTDKNIETGLIFIQLPHNVKLVTGYFRETSDSEPLLINELTGRVLHQKHLLPGTYIIDFGSNMRLFYDIHPTGNVLLSSTSSIELELDIDNNADLDLDILITLVCFDMLHYVSSNEESGHRSIITNIIAKEQYLNIVTRPLSDDLDYDIGYELGDI